MAPNALVIENISGSSCGINDCSFYV